MSQTKQKSLGDSVRAGVGRTGIGTLTQRIKDLATDRELQKKSLEVERRIAAGKLAVYSAGESRQFMADFIKKVKDTRNRLAPK